MKKVLILGINSFTGSYIAKLLSSSFIIKGTSTSGQGNSYRFVVGVDELCNLEKIIFDNAIDVVINCISLGDVDACEDNNSLCESLNYEFVKSIALLQNSLGFHLIHFSSNAVYGGETGYYSESCTKKPINFYGKTKLKADEFLLKNGGDITILRPITMYGLRIGKQRHNPFSFFCEQIKQGNKITAVNDVYVNFLYVEDLVKCVDIAIRKSIFGVFNLSGEQNLSRAAFVRLMLSYFPKSDSQINIVSSESFPTKALRPKDTSFNNSKMKKVFGFTPRTIHEIISELLNRS
ncbi:dTDP-4-dehydrorhamnose reductase [Pseudoalteromonas luteoviolacea B = ATCC 29581]|nr:dTDP-4-dehydrorhamnose reductase [Pseudoalteromonas luteoviolacea B = ATCC 29581]